MYCVWIIILGFLFLHSLKLCKENNKIFQDLYKKPEFTHLHFKTKKFFIERIEAYSNNVQTLFITIILANVGLIGLLNIVKDIIKGPLLLYSVIITISLGAIFSFWLWEYHFVRTRIKDLSRTLVVLYNYDKKEKNNHSR